jgi:thiol-disulfide isomerase/thioredoxin
MNRRTFLQQSLLVAAGLYPASKTFAGWKEGNALPALSSFGLVGAIPNIKGKVVYLDFWASWCAPCKASFPILSKWHQQFGPKGFTVLGINQDDDVAAMNDFLKKVPVPFPVVRDAEHKVAAASDASSMPTAFLIDRQGVIREVHSGFRKQDEGPLAQKIAALLG